MAETRGGYGDGVASSCGCHVVIACFVVILVLRCWLICRLCIFWCFGVYVDGSCVVCAFYVVVCVIPLCRYNRKVVFLLVVVFLYTKMNDFGCFVLAVSVLIVCFLHGVFRN